MKHPAAAAPARRATTTSFRPVALDPSAAAATAFPSVPSSLFWRFSYGLGCLFSALFGFICSRFLLLLLFSTSAPSSDLRPSHIQPDITSASSPPPPPPLPTTSQVAAGRHGILVRQWPHPNPAEVVRAHHILARVQQEQRLQYGAVKSPRPLLVITPTYRRTSQALHLTSLMHCLMNVPYPLTWLVVEAGGVSNETAALLARSGLPVLHFPFRWSMPSGWFGRDRVEARMRLHALRVIKIRRLDGIVVFADDSNVHSMELFHEAQKVKWMGSLSIGVLAHFGNPLWSDDGKENLPVPTQGPACNSSGQLNGWRNFITLPSENASSAIDGNETAISPWKMEWAGFVMSSRLVWKTAKDKPDWVKDLDEIGRTGKEIDTPLDLLKDESFVEPLGDCGKKVLLWLLRAEADQNSKFPPGWVIDPPSEIIVPSKRIDLSEPLPEAQSLKLPTKQDRMKRSRTRRSSRLRSQSKRVQQKF